MKERATRRSTSRPGRGFNFTAAMRRLCADMVARLPELQHIELERVAISFCQARKNVAHGLQATLTPLRFQQGAATVSRGGRRFGCQRVVDGQGRDYLYILSFYLPRFLNHPVEEKLSTVLHELWHISPEFDGDLRRHAGRCYAHGGSQRKYDAEMDRLAQQWLALDPPHHLYEFLECDFAQLAAEHGGVFGEQVPVPRILPLDAA
jgi:hypothetical protein